MAQSRNLVLNSLKISVLFKNPQGPYNAAMHWFLWNTGVFTLGLVEACSVGTLPGVKRGVARLVMENSLLVFLSSSLYSFLGNSAHESGSPLSWF